MEQYVLCWRHILGYIETCCFHYNFDHLDYKKKKKHLKAIEDEKSNVNLHVFVIVSKKKQKK